MDINPQTTQPISDDQELAKVLAGVNQQADEALQFEETPVLPTPGVVTPAADKDDANAPILGYNAPGTEAPATSPVPPTPAAAATPAAGATDLESIKKGALTQLRPLVDKLDLDPEEKFDTYLLLLRSTDDQALIAPAYAAAQAITDESRKAQALLDVIKEIDFLSTPKQ